MKKTLLILALMLCTIAAGAQTINTMKYNTIQIDDVNMFYRTAAPRTIVGGIPAKKIKDIEI